MARFMGVDVGGTFTDLVWADDDGEVIVAKHPTVPDAPEEGVIGALNLALDGARLAATDVFLHATTVGLNALLERRGATVGLLCTAGHRDTLEVRRGDRGDPYDLFWTPPPPLVARRNRVPVRGRILADGSEHAPLVLGDVETGLAALLDEGVDAIAIAFINAFANPAHELAALAELRRLGFAGDVSVSHRISGEYREYERTCTTVVDAMVRHRMGPYLERLDGALRERGFAGESLTTRSGGGAMTFAQAAERPFETVMSGPVAGAMATASIAADIGIGTAIGADVGGTSFDTCLVVDGKLPLLYEGSVVGVPLQAPWVDVRSIGAGGGSIAFVDAGGLLRVGPRSAGARPGPASYGRGGTEPTVTDAALVLGMLPTDLAAGVALDVGLARAALAPLAEALGMADVEQVARGVMRIISATMAGAIRVVTAERGVDPREAAVVAFGGAGPLFGTLLADELDLATVVVPPLAGNFSAWGLLGAELVQVESRTRVVPLGDPAVAAIDVLAQELFAQLGERVPTPDFRREVHLDMRYQGQEHSLTVSAPYVDGHLVGGPGALGDIFHRQYRQTFGHSMDEAVEVVTVRAVARVERPRGRHAGTAGAVPAAAGRTTAWSFAAGERVEFAVVDRASLRAGDVLAGPALVLEPTASTYVDASFRAEVHGTGALVLRRIA